jgi:hypothetical protein
MHRCIVTLVNYALRQLATKAPGQQNNRDIQQQSIHQLSVPPTIPSFCVTRAYDCLPQFGISFAETRCYPEIALAFDSAECARQQSSLFRRSSPSWY